MRRAARALTKAYDEALRPLGLRSTQFTVLQALALVREVSQGQLGQILAMDSTTLTRTLRILAGNGWIAERRGEDQRERLLSLSKAGQEQMERATPAWEKAQARLREALGEARWGELFKLTDEVANVLQNAEPRMNADERG